MHAGYAVITDTKTHDVAILFWKLLTVVIIYIFAQYSY